MNIALISDTHGGLYKSSEIFLSSQMKFFREQLIPELKARGITTIFHLGDFWDNRVHLNVRVLNEYYKLISEDFKDFSLYMLVGNHDSYYKNTIKTHALINFKNLPNVTVIDDVEKINIDGRDMLLVPWQTDHNAFTKRVSDKQLDCEVCMGHLEISGFKLNKGMVCESGVSSDVFLDNFKVTFSGHFHQRSSQKKGDNIIQYIGNTYHCTRGDIDSERGYTIFDTDTLKYEFVNNTKSIKFSKVQYPLKINEEDVRGNIVDVLVSMDSNYNEKNFQEYLKVVESYNPAMPPVVKIQSNFNQNEKIDYKVQTVTELIQEYVNDLDIGFKDEVINKIINLYDECKQNIE